MSQEILSPGKNIFVAFSGILQHNFLGNSVAPRKFCHGPRYITCWSELLNRRECVWFPAVIEQLMYDTNLRYIRTGKLPYRRRIFLLCGIALYCGDAIIIIDKIKVFLFRKFDKFTADLHPIPVKDDVWHTIGVDLIGPLLETPRGNKFTSLLQMAWGSCTHRQICHWVLFKCFTRHGCCRVKISDEEREFVNQVSLCLYFCYALLCSVHLACAWRVRSWQLLDKIATHIL